MRDCFCEPRNWMSLTLKRYSTGYLYAFVALVYRHSPRVDAMSLRRGFDFEWFTSVNDDAPLADNRSWRSPPNRAPDSHSQTFSSIEQRLQLAGATIFQCFIARSLLPVLPPWLQYVVSYHFFVSCPITAPSELGHLKTFDYYEPD